MTTSEEHAKDAEGKTSGNREWITKRLEGFSPVFEAVVTVAAVAALILAIVQTKYTREALRETRKSTDAARVSAQAAVDAVRQARDQFNAQRVDAVATAEQERARTAAEQAASEKRATASLEEARRLNHLTAEQIAQARRQTEIAAQAMKETAAQARVNREAAEISLRAFEEEYQPKIVATGITAEITDSYVLARVRVKNVGRAAATDALIVGAVAVGGDGFDITTWRSAQTIMKAIVVGPGDEVVLSIDSRHALNKITNQDFIAATKRQPNPPDWSQKRSLYVFGYVHPAYDEFRWRSLHVWFCYLYQEWSGEWDTCYPHNEVVWDRTTVEDMEDPSDAKPLTVPYAPKRILIPPVEPP